MTERSPEARLRQLIAKWTERAEAAHDKHALDSGTDDWKGLGEAYEICAEELDYVLTEDASTRPSCQEGEKHRCSGCGHRWEGQLKGTELCGDCWRIAQPELHRRVDYVCEHGVAMDVHCCGCHSGFLFDIQSCVCLNPALPTRAEALEESKEK